MAEVHLGFDTRLSRVVAIKMLRRDLAQDSIFQARFRREAQSAASLNHPNIVAVYDTGEEIIEDTNGRSIAVPYIVMEYVEGHTVKDLISDGTAVPINEAIEIVSGVLSALPASSATMAADRSYTRAEMPLAEHGETIHVVADGTTTDVVASASEGASAILDKAGVSAGPIDRVTLESNGGETTLRVARVVRGTVTTTTEIPYETEEREDAEAEQGTEKTVQEGVAGSEVTEAYQETIDGNVTVSAVLSTTRTEPTTRIVSKGTKEKKAEEAKTSTDSSSSSSSSSAGSSSSSSSGSAGSAAISGDDAAIWAAIAQCESGGNPSINTGNGYYGMYQFSLPTWRSVGGSGLPSDASAEEQTMRARMLQQRAGWGQWGCAYQLGLV